MNLEGSTRGAGALGGATGNGLLTRLKAPQQQVTVWQRLRRTAAKMAAAKVVQPPRIARMSAVLVTMPLISAIPGPQKELRPRV
jgi:hypothetical protein